MKLLLILLIIFGVVGCTIDQYELASVIGQCGGVEKTHHILDDIFHVKATCTDGRKVFYAKGE